MHTSQAKEHAQGKAKQAGRLSVLALCLLAGLGCAVWLGQALRGAAANFQMIRVAPDKLLVGTLGTPYQDVLRASGGGSSVYTFTLDNEVRDCLPAGLSLENGTPDDAAAVRGTPQEAGVFTFTVKVSSPPAVPTRQHFTILIRARAACPVLGLVEDVPCNPRLTLGVFYSETFNVAGVGTAPYQFDVDARVGERLPRGMELVPGPRADQVTLRGTPEETGFFTFHIRVEDANGCYGVICHDYPIRNNPECLLNLFPDNLDEVDSIQNEPLALSFTPNNGAAPYAFSFDNRPGESVPPGLLLASNATAERALLSGAPQEAGTFSFTLRAKDKNGCEITQSYTLAVRSKIPANQPPVCPAVTLAPQLLANGTLKLNAPFNQTFTASGGAAPYTFTVEAMPPGLLVNASTNPNEQLALGGAPTQTGSWEFRVKATDKNGCEGNRTYVLNVHDPDCPVILLPRSLPGGVAGETYAAQTIQPQPANRAYNLTISSGALPSGLMLAGNVLQGTPTLAGTFKFTLTAQSGTCSGAREYTVLIGGPFVCPPNLTQTLAAGATEAVVSYPLPTAPPGNTVTCTPAAGSTFKRGATTVTCVSAGAAATMMCSFTVTLTTCTIGCPAAVTATLPAGQCAMAVTYAAPVLEGACGPATCTPASGSSFAAGVKTVTCTAPDGAGGNSACSFTVTVNATQIPPPTCPANITRAADQNQCTAIVNYAPPVVPADCVGTTVSCVPAAGTAFPLGVTTVTCTATDAAQNKSTCAFTVTINDAQAPTLVCPDNLVKAADQNQCATAVTYTNATASDNCAGVGTPVCTPPSGATFTVGQTTVMCSVRDAAQNLATCSFTVTVNDTQAPVITACTPEQRVVANGPATVSYPLPSVTDNCANPTVSCVPASGTSFPPGVRTVTCTATDAGNNTAACSFTVTVTGCGFVPTPPPPVTANAAAGRCDAVVAYATPATNGACGVVTCAPAAGASFPVGITTVNCSTTDANGVTSSTSFTVTVNDTQAPVLTNQCPDDLRVVSATPTTVSYPLPAATDNCGTPTVSCVPASGATFALGLTTVTCTATDAARNASSCTFRVGVTPCPQLSSDPVTVEAAAGQCAAVVSSYPLPADSADCGTVTCVPPAGATFAVGVRTVTCSSTDSRGVPNASSFTVTVKDAQPPRLTCPPNLSVKAATPSAVSYDLPLVTDNCPGVGQPVCEPASGSIFPVGATTVICRARDATNNEGQCSFTVTVAPEPCRLICPAPVSTDAAPDQCTAQINYPPPATEGTCGAVTCTPPSGSSFAVGVTTVTCREASGAVCSFAVTVNDKQAPVIANCALPNLTRANDPNQCQAVVNYALPPVTDNCPGALAVCTPAPGTAFPVGVTTVTCRARDVAGNTSPSTCSFTVTVNDTQAPPPPVCSANVTRGNDPNQCQAVVNYTLPAVTDNCPGAVAVCTPAPGTAFPVGVTTVNCLARDAAGNSSPACSFTVTVNDTQVPVLAQPADLRQSAELNQCQAVVNYAPPAATENCPGTVTVSCTPAPGTAFPVGVTTVTCTARDAAGNTSAPRSFTVTVNDTQAPVIDCRQLANLTRTNDSNQCQAVVNYALPTVTDNCPGAVAVCTPAPGTAFPVGVTTVTCSARDAAGNTSPAPACSFTVTVNDTQAPVITNCPLPNVTRANDPNQCQAVVNYAPPAATDNCPGTLTVSCTPAPGTAFSVGMTTVNCTARDAAGNASSSTCSFTVTVNDTQAPVLAQKADLSQPADLNQCQAVVNYAPPIVTDNCPGTLVVSCTPAPGTAFPVGVRTVTCTARDAAGNVSDPRSFNVTVNDTQKPTMICPDSLSVLATVPTAVSFPLPTVSDNCAGVRAPVCDPASGSTFAVGTTTVTCMVADAAGNTESCSFKVTVGPCPLAVTGAPLNFAVPITAGLTPNTQATSQVLTLNNANCGTVSFGLALQRNDSNTRLTDKNDGRALLIAANGQRSLDPASRRPLYVKLVGAETLVNLCDPAQASGTCDSFTLAAGASLSLRVFFDPLIPARASSTGNLTAAQVLPLDLSSQLLLKPPAGSPLPNNQPLSTITARLAPQFRLVHPCDPTRDPAQNPVVTLTREGGGTVIAVTTTIYDPGRALQRVRYELLEGPTATVPVLTYEASTALTDVINATPLHLGQTFAFIQRFGPVDPRTEFHVRVTLNGDANLSTVSGETGCPASFQSGQPGQPERPEDPAPLILPDVELAPLTRAPRPPANNLRRRR